MDKDSHRPHIFLNQRESIFLTGFFPLIADTSFWPLSLQRGKGRESSFDTCHHAYSTEELLAS